MMMYVPPKSRGIIMAKRVLPLTDKQLRDAKPKEKNYKMFDGKGLFLLITTNGSKLWRLKYRIDGKEKLLALGSYPEITLAKARNLRTDHKSNIASSIDPMQKKVDDKSKRIHDEQAKANTFEVVANKFLDFIKDDVSKSQIDKQKGRLTNHIYPHIKNKPMNDITKKDLIAILDHIQSNGTIETAHRVYLFLGQIYRYAIGHDLVKHNVWADIDKKVILKPKVTKRHFPIITDKKDLKALLIAIDEYSGDYTTKKALQVMPYLALRPTNIRHLEWGEVDLKNKTIDIPGQKMKARKKDKEKYRYVAPLHDTVIEHLREVQKFTGDGKYVFPSMVYKNKPMSENTLNVSLRRMGYTKDEIVSHSFRGIFSTIAHDHMATHGVSSLAIEKQLNHQESNQVKAAYNHSEYWQERVKLVTWYGDYLNGVKNAKNI